MAIHRRIGMSGGLFVSALLRETGGGLRPSRSATSTWLHAAAFGRRRATVRPLPGAGELLEFLTDRA